MATSSNFKIGHTHMNYIKLKLDKIAAGLSTLYNHLKCLCFRLSKINDICLIYLLSIIFILYISSLYIIFIKYLFN